MNKTSRFRRAALFAAVLVLAAAGISAGCALYRIERDLPEKYAKFLSDVRYLITSSERKTFLHTPDGAKDTFIEDFWFRRDPDPDTPDNAVKTEYFDRIKKANEFFRSEGREGWLTDRGRIYVIYGPPDQQRILTIAETGGANCREVWYYGGFPVVFLDEACAGHYRLVTVDLIPIRDMGLDQPPAKPERGASGTPRGLPGSMSRGAKAMLDFSAGIRGTVRRADRVEGVLHLEIPLRLIWFKSDGGRFLTTFDVSLKVKNVEAAVLWEKSVSVEANYAESEIAARSAETHAVDIPILIDQEDALAKISAVPITIEVVVKNKTGGESVTKAVAWE